MLYCIYYHVPPPVVTIHHCCFMSNAFYFICSECCMQASTMCFLVFPAFVRTCSRECSWTLYSYQEQGDSGYSFTLKWWNGSKKPFHKSVRYCLFSPPTAALCFIVLLFVWVFSGFIQWSKWQKTVWLWKKKTLHFLFCFVF